MKTFVLSLLILTLFSASALWAQQELPRLRPMPPNPLYSSQGFRLGYILRLSERGLTFWRYRYEGQLMLGIGTDQGPIYDNNCLAEVRTAARKNKAEVDVTNRVKADENVVPESEMALVERCKIGDNPFVFSFFDDSYYEYYRTLPEGPVVIFYQRPVIAPQSVLTDTKTFLRGIWPVNPQSEIPKSMVRAPGALASENLTAQKGALEGRVIGATIDDIILETFEITIQLGDSANNFRTLSVANAELFDYIVQCMLTGKMLRIEYVMVITILKPLSKLRGYSTNYRISAVHIIE